MVRRLSAALLTLAGLALVLPDVASAGNEVPSARAAARESAPSADDGGGKGGGGKGGGGKGGGAGKKGGGKKGGGKGGKKGGKKGKGADGVGPFNKDKYPMQERLRPLVLPDSMGEVGLEVGYTRVADTDVAAAGFGFHYGVGDKVDFGAATALLLAPDVDWGQAITLDGHYLAYDSKEFDFAPGLVIPISFVDGAPFGVVLDLPSRYVASDVVFFTFGQGAVPIGLSPDFTLAVAANGGVGFQLSDGFALIADTSLLTLLLVPDVDVTGIWDVVNLGLTGQYSWDRNWDVGARLGFVTLPDVPDSTTFGINVFGRVRF